MKYRIVGSTVPAVEIAMEAGESMYTQSGGMAWKTEGIEMSTSTRGGFLKGLGRMFSGESFFMATYKATKTRSDRLFHHSSRLRASPKPGSCRFHDHPERRFSLRPVHRLSGSYLYEKNSAPAFSAAKDLSSRSFPGQAWYSWK